MYFPVQTAWSVAAGAELMLVAVHDESPGVSRPPVLFEVPPQMNSRVPVHANAGEERAEGAPVVGVAVQPTPGV